MIFLTVGTRFPFTRLVKAVDAAVANSLIDDKVFAQIGNDSYVPQNMEFVQLLGKREYDRYANEASALISHAGMGTIIMALEHQKPILVMPRLAKFGEHRNDHQVDKENRLGYLINVYVAHSVEEVNDMISESMKDNSYESSVKPIRANELIENIKKYLA